MALMKKTLLLGVLLAASTSTASSAGCFCTVVYQDGAGNIVGIDYPNGFPEGCDEQDWGERTGQAKVYYGCNSPI